MLEIITEAAKEWRCLLGHENGFRTSYLAAATAAVSDNCTRSLSFLGMRAVEEAVICGVEDKAGTTRKLFVIDWEPAE